MAAMKNTYEQSFIETCPFGSACSEVHKTSISPRWCHNLDLLGNGRHSKITFFQTTRSEYC